MIHWQRPESRAECKQKSRNARNHIDTSFSYSRVFNISLKFYSMNEHCTVYILYSCG